MNRDMEEEGIVARCRRRWCLSAARCRGSGSGQELANMSWLFLDWFVPVYLLVSVLVLAGFGACLYCLEPGLQDAHKWSNKTVRHHPLVASVNCTDEDTNALI
ncbi:unnamed protein product [Boreogadus saida]